MLSGSGMTDGGTAAAKRRAAEEEAARSELFASDTPSPSLRRRKTESDEQASQNVTEGLMELRQIMQGQLQHSHTTMEVLVKSSNKIKETKSGMEEIGSSVKVSQSLISKLNRRDITDKVLIFLALVFFFSVVLYIIRKRFIGWII